MPAKKRRLSPSASSRSSATPAPAAPASIIPVLPGPSSGLGLADTAPASPSAESSNAHVQHNRDSETPALAGGVTGHEPMVAKPGVVVIGSGDGRGCGEECYLWGDLPMNKNGYRYLPCGPSPTPSPSPYYPFYRCIPYAPPTPPVHVSWLDRSYFLRLSSDALTATTDRGFRSGRANIAVREGTWYFECRILRGNGGEGSSKGSGLVGEGGNAHVRVGWGRREANLDAPVGADGYAYGLRDVNGDKIHFSRPRPYASLATTANRDGLNGLSVQVPSTFGTGDVVGCLISLPKRAPDTANGTLPPIPPSIQRKRVSVRYRGQNYFEMDDYTPQKEMEALVDREGKMGKARLEAEMQGSSVADGDTIGAVQTSDADRPAVNGTIPKGKKVKNTKKGRPDLKAESAIKTEDTPRSRPLPRLRGSRIEFFINGQSLGPAFEDIYDFLPLPPIPATPRKGHHGHGHSHSHAHAHEKDARYDDGTLGYYPMISCFGRGKAQLNFGPDFDHPVPQSARSMSERWAEYAEEERILDERDEAESRAKLEEEMEREKQRRSIIDAKIAKKGVGAGGKKASAGAGPAAIGGSPLSGNTVDDGRKREAGTGTPTPTPGPGPTPGPASDLQRSVTPSGSLSGLGIKASKNNLTPESTPAPESTAEISIKPVKEEASLLEDTVMGSTPASPDAGQPDSGMDTPVVETGMSMSGGKGKGKKGRGGRGSVSTNASRAQSRSISRATSVGMIVKEEPSSGADTVKLEMDRPTPTPTPEGRDQSADAEGEAESDEEGVQWG